MLYQAIMRAADHIEQNPELFDFHASVVPECGSPGCALGWIGFFANISPGISVSDASDAMDTSDWTFYHVMDALTEDVGDDENGNGWMANARLCALGLRRYAEKYFGHERQVAELKASLESLPVAEVA